MRRTMAARAVARALLAKPDSWHWGYGLAQEADLPSGVLYPIVARMEVEGWLTSHWADPDGSYPRRRYYQLTDTGRAQLAAFVDGANR
jgi:PadR family transcriptional regulator PadR